MVKKAQKHQVAPIDALKNFSYWTRVAIKSTIVVVLGGLAYYVYRYPQNWKFWRPFLPRDLYKLYLNYIARPRLSYIFYNTYMDAFVKVFFMPGTEKDKEGLTPPLMIWQQETPIKGTELTQAEIFVAYVLSLLATLKERGEEDFPGVKKSLSHADKIEALQDSYYTVWTCVFLAEVTTMCCIDFALEEIQYAAYKDLYNSIMQKKVVSNSMNSVFGYMCDRVTSEESNRLHSYYPALQMLHTNMLVNSPLCWLQPLIQWGSTTFSDSVLKNNSANISVFMTGALSLMVSRMVWAAREMGAEAVLKYNEEN